MLLDRSIGCNDAVNLGDTFAVARQYLAAGFSVIPVRSDGSKAPAFSGWRGFSERKPTPAELLHWFTHPIRHGIGIPGGPASGHLLIFDFESIDAFQKWDAMLTQEEREHIAGSPVVQTPRPGIHVYIRLTDSVRGTKYARDAAGACLIETRGNGHYVVAPGSPPSCHPTGLPYLFLRRGWIDGLTPKPIPLEVFHRLTAHAADLNEYAKPEPREVVGERWTPTGVIGDRPGDQFNVRVAWGDILRPHGWRVYSSNPNRTYWSRPGKVPPGVSASTGFCRGSSGHDLLYVFTSSARMLEPDTSYSRFGAYVALNHGGDFRAATWALWRVVIGIEFRSTFGVEFKATRPVERSYHLIFLGSFSFLAFIDSRKR